MLDVDNYDVVTVARHFESLRVADVLQLVCVLQQSVSSVRQCPAIEVLKVLVRGSTAVLKGIAQLLTAAYIV